VLTLAGLTLRGGRIGLALQLGAQASLTRSRVLGQGLRALQVADTFSRLDGADLVLGPLAPDTGDFQQHLLVDREGVASLERVHTLALDGSVAMARVEGSHVMLADVAMSPVRLRGHGLLQVQEGARLDGARLALRGYPNAAIVSSSGARVTVEDVHISDPLEQEGISTGVGLVAGDGFLRAERVSMVRARDVGALVIGAGAVLELESSTIRDMALRFGGVQGAGVDVLEGAQATLRNVRLEGLYGHGVQVERDSRILLQDVLLADVSPAERPESGVAVQAVWGEAVLERVHVLRATNEGVLSVGEGATVSISDSLIEAIRQNVDPVLGIGLASADGGALSARRVRIVDSYGGAAVENGMASLSLERCVISDMAPGAEGKAGFGVLVVDGGQLNVSGSRIERVHNAGALVQEEGTHAELASTVIRDVAVGRFDTVGRGVSVSLGASVSALRVLIERVVEGGIVQHGGTLDANDLWIRDVRANGAGFATGLLLWEDATANLQRLVLTDMVGAGLSVVEDSTAIGDHLYVGPVASGPVVFAGSGRPVAYGLQVAGRGSLDLSHAVMDGGGFGFFEHAGELRLHDAVIVRQLDAASVSSGLGVLELERVWMLNNAIDDVIVDTSLPSTAALPPPTPVGLDL
jgi:hypothetical protein